MDREHYDPLTIEEPKSTVKITLSGMIDGNYVFVNGKRLNPEESQAVFNHSPDGFSWGYGGSGPSQLALAVLLKFTDRETALKNYQEFKWDVIAALPQADFTKQVDLTRYLQ